MESSNLKNGYNKSPEFQKLFLDLPLPSLIWRVEGNDFKLVGFNKYAEILTNNEIKNFRGILASKFYREAPEVIENLHKSYKEEKSFEVESPFKLRTTGELKYLKATFSFLPPDLVVIHIKDMSKYKSIEKKLKENIENFKILYENIPGGTMILSKDYQIVDVNERSCKITGYSREQLIGESCSILCPLEPTSKECAIWKKNKNCFTNMDTKIKCKDGSIVPILKNANKIEIDKQVYVLESFQDISDQKELEEKLRESESKLQVLNQKLQEQVSIKTEKLEASEEKINQIFEVSPYLVIILDLEGNILECSKSIENFLPKMNRNDLIGKNINEISLKPHNLKKITSEFQKLPILLNRKEKTKDSGEFSYFKENGEQVWIHYFASIINIKKRKFIPLIFQDITEKRFALDALKNSEKKYRKAYNRAEFYKNLFIHDINSIFQNIKSSIELSKLFLKEKNFEKITENHEIIESQFARIDMLVSNVRNLYKLESESFDLFPKDAYKILKKSIEFIKNSFYDRKIEITIEIDESINKSKKGTPNLKLNANELFLEVCENILMNAVKYNDNETVKIIIRISEVRERRQDYIKFEFIDNGIGINNSRKKHIFQESIDLQDTSKKGLGFGLTLIKKVIESYNGKIWVENRIEGDYAKGSNFIILIPKA